MKDFIGSFEEYVEKLCPNTNYEQALGYATQGENILISFLKGDTSGSDLSPVDVGFCILWCLLKIAYDNKMPFGKGVFLIQFENDLDATKIQKLLKVLSQTPSYSRISSHFNDRVEGGQRGIDHHKRSTVTIPYKFKTLCFGLNREASTNKTLFIKPETQGVNIFRDPVGSFLHGLNYLKHKFIAAHKVDGTSSFRETGVTRHDFIDDFNQKGNEIRFVVSRKGIILKKQFNLFASVSSRLNVLPEKVNCDTPDAEFVNIFIEYLKIYIQNIENEIKLFKKLRGSNKNQVERFIRIRQEELFEVSKGLNIARDVDGLYDLAHKVIDHKNTANVDKPPMIFSNISPLSGNYSAESSNFEKLKSVVKDPTSRRYTYAC